MAGILISLYGLYGCTKPYKSLCRHTAPLSVEVFAEKGYKTRIVTGRVKGKNFWHTQGQAYIDGEWKWLQVSPWPEVFVGEMEYELEFVKKEKTWNLKY